MLRSIGLSLALVTVCLVADQADARGRRSRCSGGSCGVSSGCYGGSCGVTTTSGCFGGQCQAPATTAGLPQAKQPVLAPSTTTAEVKQAAPVSQPVVQSNYSNGTRRYARWRTGGRRFR